MRMAFCMRGEACQSYREVHHAMQVSEKYCGIVAVQLSWEKTLPRMALATDYGHMTLQKALPQVVEGCEWELLCLELNY